VVSVETEVDGDKIALAQALYAGGMVPQPKVCSYSSHPDLGGDYVAFLKHDGSVTGGELITWLLDLSKTEHANAFMEVLKRLRGLERAGVIHYNPNCGGHVHIDAHQFGTHDVWRLALVFGFLEDVIYRIAGAGHDYGHRSLVKGYDRAAGIGHGYANKTTKGPFGSAANTTLMLKRQARMSGLNFTSYYEAAYRCRCGAMANFVDTKTCKCDLGKCTIEWRVWNSQGNPRILHAWFAIMQAVHAYCERDEEVTPDFEFGFPAMDWSARPLNEENPLFVGAGQDRLRWMFANLAFTPAERDSLLYTLKKSEFAYFADSEMFFRELEGVAGPPVTKNKGRVACRVARKKKIALGLRTNTDESFAKAREYEGWVRQNVPGRAAGGVERFARAVGYLDADF
jgi:hypothetical protein